MAVDAVVSRNKEHVQYTLGVWNRQVASGVGQEILSLWPNVVRLALALSYGPNYSEERLIRENLLSSSSMIMAQELGLQSFGGM